jgi:hypothetical protein
LASTAPGVKNPVIQNRSSPSRCHNLNAF